MKIQPAARRSQLTKTATGFDIVIPAKRHWPVIIFLCVWLCGWVLGEVSVITKLLGGEAEKFEEQFGMIVWLFGWTFGGVVVISFLLWNLFGRELISVSSQTLTIRKEVFGIGQTKEFEMKSVKNMQATVIQIVGRNPEAARHLLGMIKGRIGFDYGAKTYWFGNGLDEAEGKIVAQEIVQRFNIPTN